MTIDEWGREQRKRIDDFIADWKEHQRENRDLSIWPETINPGEWDEQFKLWRTK
jgi:hypothetical protein